MVNENSRKIKLLKLWELLKSETDENNPMDTKTIIKRLGDEGIQVDRKILYADIDLLNKYGFEVLKDRSRSNKYYVVDRNFDPHEVRILMDAVHSAGFITEKKTDELITKVSALAGSKMGEMLKGNITKYSTVKSTNELIYYSIDTIVRAKQENKKIGFYYFDYNENRERVYRKDKKWYIVNPVATFIDDNQYYLVCYDDKHKTLNQYRVDRMESVAMLNEDITPNEKAEKASLAEHKRQLFSMYGGKVERVTFEISKNLIDMVLDRFGERVKINAREDKAICVVEVQVSPMFIAWCCSYGAQLRVTQPKNVVSQIKDHIELIKELYQ
ncbi:MAG: WYL domain-containing protein [Clostridia bacterium]|nr:WYL domain-containing protein [Clostridia bacterium]